MGRNGILKKSKLKINILDLVIFVVILCVVAVIIFHDTISEVFSEPQIVTIKYSVTVKEVPYYESNLFNAGNSIKISLSDVSAEAKIEDRLTDSSDKKDCYDITLTLTGEGYKKFGKVYTGSGIRLSEGQQYVISSGDKVYTGYCAAAEK